MMNKAPLSVIVGVDGEGTSRPALAWAVRQARNSGARLVAVHSWSLVGEGAVGRHVHAPHPLAFAGNQLQNAAELMVRQAFQDALGGIPQDVAVVIETPEGAPGEVLTKMSGGPGNLLVVGTGHKSRWQRLTSGSVSRYCVEHSECPVVVIPGGLW